MRIPIREQFSLLVLLVSLVALMVLALAVVRVNSSTKVMAELLLMQSSGSKVTTSSLVSGKMAWFGRSVFRGQRSNLQTGYPP